MFRLWLLRMSSSGARRAGAASRFGRAYLTFFSARCPSGAVCVLAFFSEQVNKKNPPCPSLCRSTPAHTVTPHSASTRLTIIITTSIVVHSFIDTIRTCTRKHIQTRRSKTWSRRQTHREAFADRAVYSYPSSGSPRRRRPRSGRRHHSRDSSISNSEILH